MGLTASQVMAADALGLYVGAAVGESHVRADELSFYKTDGSLLTDAVSVTKRATAWKLLVGVRPISWVGAELTYLDFGDPTVSQGPPPQFGLSYDARLRAKAVTALGVLYAPLPIPHFDLFAKAGLARLQTSDQGSAYYGCDAPLFCGGNTGEVHSRETNTRFAYGAGAQARFSAIGVRLEYERISASSGDPDLLSLGVTFSF